MDLAGEVKDEGSSWVGEAGCAFGVWSTDAVEKIIRTILIQSRSSENDRTYKGLFAFQ